MEDATSTQPSMALFMPATDSVIPTAPRTLEAIDFSDKFIYDELKRPRSERRMPTVKVDSRETIRAFEKWAADPNKTKY